MSGLKNEFPKRIIRVNGCHECPHLDFLYDQWKEFKSMNCKVCAKNNKFKIDSYVDNKTFPDNWPLEKVVQIITEAKE